MPDTPLYLGVDLGGTNIQCGIVSGKQVTHRSSTKTKKDQGLDAVLERIAKLLEGIVDDAGLKMSDIAGVGIGAPGVIDFDKGVVTLAVNLGWKDVPLGKLLSKRLDGMPVTLDNDVNVGAWGEYRAGASEKFDSSLAVFIGTGIGGGLIFDGQLFHGHHMTAGEIGHTVYNPFGLTGRRTVENITSRTNLVQHLTQLIHTGHKSVVTELVDGDLSKIRSKVLAKAVEKKDPLTLQVLQHGADALGVAIANAVTLLSLPCVVVGGGLTEAVGEPIVEMVRASFEQHVFPDALRKVKVVPGKLFDDAGVVGAALLARDRQG